MSRFLRLCIIISLCQKLERWGFNTFKVIRITKYDYLLYQVTPLKIMCEVNQTIIPALGLDLGKTTISENCARWWLKKLGYELTTVKKGIYVDGPEHPNVVKYCKTFLAKIADNKHLWNQYDDTTLDIIPPSLPVNQWKHVPIHHDVLQKMWTKNGKMLLRKKGQGKTIHVSDFVTKESGRLSLSEQQVIWFLTLAPLICLPISWCR